ncbi:extracellular solute-binding protein [Salinibius halmophilus]|uniref:extracellular solute-binding protein n=1 Tax=Salinibius halmophilus TaxID=1853216 RepID=UPI000E65EE99|nr:extracellular solute-binding protein [Salinibius halmophilus]
MKPIKPVMGLLSAAILSSALLAGCGSESNETPAANADVAEQTTAASAYPATAELPANIEWLTNDSDPVFANVDAPKGGEITYADSSFPLTIRGFGPDSNSAFATYVRSTWTTPVLMHPNTRNYVPYVATHWAYGEDGKTIYFKLNENARWSDGEPLTADDYVFGQEFLTYEPLQAPWYKNYFTEEIVEIAKVDEHTIKVVANSKKAPDELLYQLNSIHAIPEHAVKPVLNEEFIREQNWTIFPVLSAYNFTEIDMGKKITMERNPDWWAKDLKYFQGRYNVDKINIEIVRDLDIQKQALNKGEIDALALVWPEQWHSFNDNYSAWANGYLAKTWVYADAPQGLAGIWLNQDHPLLANKDIRLGVAASLNIEKMINQALRGDYTHMRTVGSGYGRYTNPDVKRYDFDPDLAREHFAKAGYDQIGPNGFLMNDQGQELVVELLYMWNAHTERVAILTEEAKKAGLNLKLTFIEGSQGWTAAQEKNHQAAFIGMGTSFFPDHFQYFHSENAKANTNSFTMMRDPELDQYLEAYRNEFDPAAREAANHKAEEIIMESAAFIPTYSVPFDRYVHWRWLKLPEEPGTSLTDSQYLYGVGGYHRFWVDQEEKERTLAAKAAGEKLDQINIIDRTYQAK